MHGCRGGEHQDVGAGRVLGRVQLGRLHVQSGAAPEHRASGHGVFGREIKHLLSFAKPQLLALVPKRDRESFPNTWHNNEGSLGLHGHQASTENAGGVCSRDPTHPAHVLQPLAQRLQVPAAQQTAPV